MNDADTERICWACRQSLTDKQIVCLKCNSWQNWRRHLNLSNTTLSLIVAILALASVLIQNAEEIWIKWFPRYEIAATGFVSRINYPSGRYEFGIVAYVENIGTANITLPISISCLVETGDGSVRIGLGTTSNIAVKVGETNEMRYTGDVNLGSTHLGDQISCNEVFDFGNRGSFTLTFMAEIPEPTRTNPWTGTLETTR